tara:strand:- start:2413 stop:2571 length:159 start_codon:yes stop_codon:yes gene_type:complete
MPYGMKKVKGGYKVKNKRSGRVMAKKTTKTKAKKQIGLLNRVDKKKRIKRKY